MTNLHSQKFIKDGLKGLWKWADLMFCFVYCPYFLHFPFGSWAVVLLPNHCLLIKNNLEGYLEIRPQGYKTFFMLNLVEHEILNAHKYKKYLKTQRFLGSDKPKMPFFVLINIKMLIIVGILIFMSRKKSMLN